MPMAQCRCGLSGDNGTQELWPGQEATIECHNWWVPWGSWHEQDHTVPSLSPSEWGALGVLVGLHPHAVAPQHL